MSFPFLSLWGKKTKLQKGDEIHLFCVNPTAEGILSFNIWFERRGKRIETMKKNNARANYPLFFSYNLSWRDAKNMVILLAATHGLAIAKEKLIQDHEYISTLG